MAPEITAANIAAAARRLNELRENWLNPPEWTERIPEVVPGYPDRIVAKPGHEAELKKRTLTNLYNQRPAWLDNAHRALDAAVAAAYGWHDYTPDLPDEEILNAPAGAEPGTQGGGREITAVLRGLTLGRSGKSQQAACDQRAIVSRCRTARANFRPTAVARHFPRPTAGLRVEQSRKDHSWAAPQSFKPLRLDWLRGRFVSRTMLASVRRSLDDYRLGSGLQGCL